MLAALLLNIPKFTASGPARGYTSSRVAAATSWNPNWAKDYGPDKVDDIDLETAIEALKKAEYVPSEVMEAKDIIHSKLSDGLIPELVIEYELMIIISYLFYLDWRRKEDEEIAIILLTFS